MGYNPRAWVRVTSELLVFDVVMMNGMIFGAIACGVFRTPHIHMSFTHTIFFRRSVSSFSHLHPFQYTQSLSRPLSYFPSASPGHSPSPTTVLHLPHLDTSQVTPSLSISFVLSCSLRQIYSLFMVVLSFSPISLPIYYPTSSTTIPFASILITPYFRPYSYLFFYFPQFPHPLIHLPSAFHMIPAVRGTPTPRLSSLDIPVIWGRCSL